MYSNIASLLYIYPRGLTQNVRTKHKQIYNNYLTTGSEAGWSERQQYPKGRWDSVPRRYLIFDYYRNVKS